MEAIEIEYNKVLHQVEQIIGNVKGGIKQPLQAAKEIHLIYANFVQTEIRYPEEPPIYQPEQTQTDRAMQKHFEQSDKGN